MYFRMASRKLDKISRRVVRTVKRSVATWSSLGAAFNTLPGPKSRFLSEKKTLFGIDKLSSPIGFYAIKDDACKRASELVQEATSSKRERKMVDVFDDLSNVLCCVADMAEFIRVAHPKAAYREAAEHATYHISTLVEELNTNRELYDCLRSVVFNGDKVPTSDVDNHVAKLFLFDFEQSGIHLSDSERKKVVSLTESAMTLGQYFINGTSRERVIEKNKLPSGVTNFFQVQGDKIVVNSLQSDCAEEKVREAAYKVYLHPDDHQEYLLQELLKVRHELAVTCGFSSFTHRALRGTTAESPEFVATFLETLNKEIKPLAMEDLRSLLKVKQRENPKAQSIYPWDVNYLSGQLKHEFMQVGF